MMYHIVNENESFVVNTSEIGRVFFVSSSTPSDRCCDGLNIVVKLADEVGCF